MIMSRQTAQITRLSQERALETARRQAERERNGKPDRSPAESESP